MAAMMQVTGGTADFQVVARDSRDRAVASVRGLCRPMRGAIEARLCDRGAPVAGLDWRQAGAAADGEWAAKLANLPVGGPYDLEIRLLDASRKPVAATTVRSILVGDLWVLAGQSNMQGVGKISELPPAIAAVHMFSIDDRWALAAEPLHPLLESTDEAHWRPWIPPDQTREGMLEAFRRGARAPDAPGVGPGLPFAGELYRLTQVPIGLLPCALGGSSLEQWNPALKGAGGRSLYGAMIRRIAAVGGRVRGMLWYQGESDATVEMGPTYRRRFADFIRAVRKDVKDPGLPVLFVQIGRFIVPPDSLPQGWELVREGQRRVEADLDHVAVVPAVDASLVDLIHLDTAGQIEVGRRLALQAAREVFWRKEFARGPRLAEVKTNADRTAVTVAFGEVNGRLRAEGRPTGFVISDAAGESLPIITRVDLPEESPTAVVLRLGQPLPEGAQLWYGRGLDPYVNLTDDRDMGMLAFGPVPIPHPAG